MIFKWNLFFMTFLYISIFIFCIVNWTYVPCELNKKCDFINVFEFFSTFWNSIHFRPRRCSLNFRKFFILLTFIFCLVNQTYVSRVIEQKCDFVNLFEFYSTFWNLIHFLPRRFSLNSRKLLLKFMFIFCLVHWIYVSRCIVAFSAILSHSKGYIIS